MAERLFEKTEPTIYKQKTYTPMSPEEYEEKWRKGAFPMGEGTETGKRLFAKDEEPFVMHFLQEPKKTESREFIAGQISEEALEQNRQRNAIIKEYKDFFLTQTDLGQDKKWVEYIPTMELKELEDLYGQYQDWEVQREQQNLTQYYEALGIPTELVEQLQRTYPEEELASKAMMASGWLQSLNKKFTIGALENLDALLHPEPEEEPTTKDYLTELGLYKGLRTGEEALPMEQMRPEVESEFNPQAKSMIQDVLDAYQELGDYPPDLLDAIIEEFAENYGITMTEEEAIGRINWILQGALGVTVDFGMGEETGAPATQETPETLEIQPEKTTLLKKIFSGLGIGG